MPLIAELEKGDTAVTLLKSAGRFLLGFLVLWTVLYLAADFSMRQSAALALLAQFVVYGFWTMAPRPAIVLVPHRILIRPIWRRILLDLELIATDAEYDSLDQTFNSLPPERYNVFRDGLCFTVLDSEQFGQRWLIYSDDNQVFVSEGDFERSLAPLTIPDESPLRDSPAPRGPLSPMLFVSHGVGGCGIGVIVDRWWWEKRKESVTAKMGKLDAREIVFDSCQIRLTLADISFSEFSLYWKRLKPYPKGDEFWKKHRNEERAKCGWIDADNSREALRHRYFRLEHKYFNVSHHSI